MPKVKKGKVKADYFVTGVWKNKQRLITHLLLHEATDQSDWTLGEITTIDDVVKLLDQSKLIRTMRWSYVSAKWIPGVLLKIESCQDGDRLVKSTSNNVVTDNLDHLILMHTIL